MWGSFKGKFSFPFSGVIFLGIFPEVLKTRYFGACLSYAVSMHTPMQYVCLMWSSNPLLFRDSNHTFVILLVLDPGLTLTSCLL